MKAMYRRNPKDKNIGKEQMIYKHTERLGSVSKDKVETRLK